MVKIILSILIIICFLHISVDTTSWSNVNPGPLSITILEWTWHILILLLMRGFRRLEIRRDGAWQNFVMAVQLCLCGWYLWDHPGGSQFVWYKNTDWYNRNQDLQEKTSSDSCCSPTSRQLNLYLPQCFPAQPPLDRLQVSRVQAIMQKYSQNHNFVSTEYKKVFKVCT